MINTEKSLNILGRIGNGSRIHYSFNGEEWTLEDNIFNNYPHGSSVSVLSYYFIFKGFYYIIYRPFYSSDPEDSILYKYENDQWIKLNISVPSTKFNASEYFRTTVFFQNKLHFLMGTSHITFDGFKFEVLEDIPYNTYGGSAVVYNNEIHVIGGNNYSKNHYKWDGNSWDLVTTMTLGRYAVVSIVYNNKIYLLGRGARDNGNVIQSCQVFNGESWQSVEQQCPISPSFGIVYNNEIHVFVNNSTNNHYKMNIDETWELDEDVPVSPYEILCYIQNKHLINNNPISASQLANILYNDEDSVKKYIDQKDKENKINVSKVSQEDIEYIINKFWGGEE